MAFSDDIHSTQQFVNAAETFIDALSAHFPAKRFDEFFHAGTLMQAYWAALQRALDRFTTRERALLVRGLMDKQVFAETPFVDALLSLFIPGQIPDYLAVSEHWELVLDPDEESRDSLVVEAETFFTLLADELRQSPDLRQALQQLALVRTRPVQAWEKDASTAEQDLSRLLDAALISGPGTLSLQVRHLMSLTSDRPPLPGDASDLALLAMARLAARLSTDDLRLVWEQLDTIRDPVLHVRILAQIAPYLNRLGISGSPLTLVREAFESATEPFDPSLQVDILLQLAPHLDSPNRGAMPSFQQRVLEGVQAIDDPASRVRALGALIPYLPVNLQAQAVTMAFEATGDGINNDAARAEALSALAPHLPAEFQERLMALAYELNTPDARALLLGRMIPHVSRSLKTQALIGALNAIEQISGDESRTRALIALAPYIDSVGPLRYLPEGLRQAIEVTFSIDFVGDRARAFAALAPYLSPELLREALHATRDIVDDYDRAVTITSLAQHLPADLQVAAFGVAQELRPANARATALAAIAPYLSLTARQQALEDALAAAMAIDRRYERVVALADLAPHLREDLHMRALNQALTATRSIPDESERGRALVFLAPHLMQEQLPDALADGYTILDPMERTPALSALMPRLPDEPRIRVGLDTLKAVRKVKPPHHKASILASIAPVLPDKLIHEAVRVADQIDTPYDRMHVLTALLPRDPQNLHDIALAAAHAVPNRYQRVNALLELIPHTSVALRYPILDEALDTALGIHDDYDRASALAHLGPYIDAQTDVQNQQQDAIQLALTTCFDVEDPALRADLLARLASVWYRLLNPAQSYTLWRMVAIFLRRRPQVEVMGDLAALAPVIAQMGASKAVEAIAEKVSIGLFAIEV